MKIIGVIPARGGSKGIPGKNKKILIDKPLILYTIEQAKLSKLDDLVISTDDNDIIEIAKSENVRVIRRPPLLARDETPTLPVLKHAIKKVKDKYDAVMTLQPTSPLRTAAHINEAIRLFNENPEADSLVSVVKVPHNFTPDSLMKMDGKWLNDITAKKVYRRQLKPILYARNGAAIYITKTNKLEEFIIGGNILPFEMSKLESIDIDNMEDWKLAEILLMRN